VRLYVTPACCALFGASTAGADTWLQRRPQSPSSIGTLLFVIHAQAILAAPLPSSDKRPSAHRWMPRSRRAGRSRTGDLSAQDSQLFSRVPGRVHRFNSVRRHTGGSDPAIVVGGILSAGGTRTRCSIQEPRHGTNIGTTVRISWRRRWKDRVLELPRLRFAILGHSRPAVGQIRSRL